MSEYKPARPNSIGGQALIEGVMMRGKDKISIAVRKPDGIIELKVDAISKKSQMAIFKWPIIRGIVALISSMIIGVKALTYSAEFFVEGDGTEEKGKFETWLYAKLGKKSRRCFIRILACVCCGFCTFAFWRITHCLGEFFKRFYRQQCSFERD